MHDAETTAFSTEADMPELVVEVQGEPTPAQVAEITRLGTAAGVRLRVLTTAALLGAMGSEALTVRERIPGPPMLIEQPRAERYVESGWMALRDVPTRRRGRPRR